MTPAPLLQVEDLQTHIRTDNGIVRAVEGASFALGRGETLGIVGESGCGKSLTALSIMQLIPPRSASIVGGRILYSPPGKATVDLARLDPLGKEMRRIRGNEIAMIFQEPMSSLNPVYSVGHQIVEAVMLHQRLGRQAARERAIEMLERVGIPAPRQRIDEYPHQLSGGMRQRVMIAMALSCNPNLLIADEPTTALDVTVQAQILRLLMRLRHELRMALMLITHDFGVIAGMVERVCVMHDGRIVETGDVDTLFAQPRHAYTRALLDAVPRIETAKRPA
jgi:ABC-type dipeptide/oligopeptide/nickel transport system ATPase component